MDIKALEKFFQNLDRSQFVPARLKGLADDDSPLPIGHGQTISQPSLVVEMTRILAPKPDSKVLEIGTGSGYQTAFLAEFSEQVYTVELLEDLSLKAQEILADLGYENINYRISDGSLGWAEEAPFDRIIVTASAGKRPDALIEQLAPNGRMVVPVGSGFWQDLLLITKNKRGEVSEENLMGVRFVELKGEYGWSGDG